MDFQAMIKAERARIRADMLKDRTKEHPGQLLSIPKSVDLGSGVSYCSDFFSEGEAAELVNSIEATPQSEWATLAKRRLLNLGGVPHPSGSWTEDLPGDIAGLSISRLTSMGVFTTDEPPNQILLNEYRDGAGIDAHNDGPLFEPIACIVSLESDAVIHFFDPEPPLSPSISAPTPPSSRRASQLMPLSEKCAGSVAGQSTQPVCSVILRRNSCLVFKGPIAYQRWTHAVADSMVDVVDVTRVANAQQAPVAVGESEDQGLRYVKRSPRRLSQPCGGSIELTVIAVLLTSFHLRWRRSVYGAGSGLFLRSVNDHDKHEIEYRG
eukprot:CAMPEP_0171831024 /NCGR_PEP_ID=MMETSP0992-20121227/8552_1 /TAXON_ID=483369 /ORGANISM="non described non described, Strain CCMP2098" /LENGTH=322 /DNA_ID=CAMNT_0012446399 /DNA_START=166 /DNA_END=1132 /DNA_ORIENTATION=-